MGSRMMHLAIGTKLIEVLDLPSQPFLLGNLIPDIHHYMGVTKFQTHYVRQDQDRRYYFDLDYFVQKYQSHLSDPFYLGYYCHLISDQIWFQTVHAKWIWPLPTQERGVVYQDFARLNPLLIQQYHPSPNIEPINQCLIQEINLSKTAELLNDLHRDFQTQYEPLQLLRAEDIFHYINESVQSCQEKFKSILTEGDRNKGILWRS